MNFKAQTKQLLGIWIHFEEPYTNSSSALISYFVWASSLQKISWLSNTP